MRKRSVYKIGAAEKGFADKIICHKINIYIIPIILVAVVLMISACGGPKRSSQEIIEEMVVCYGTYQERADKETEKLLNELKSSDADAYEKWAGIMDEWRSVNKDIKINYDVLPDGLPETNELCLVALGFQLKPDGTMRPELVERLKVLKKCAEKYPDALIICTGGGTATDAPTVTEAGKMAEWLIQNGIAKERIEVEDKSITTAQNAIFSYDILEKEHPEVSSIAIISSDYHIATGTLLYDAEAMLREGKDGEEMPRVVSNAAYRAPEGSLSTMFQAGALIELSGDVETAFDIYYENYDIHELPTPE